MENVLQFIIDNWESLSYVVFGGGAVGVGSYQGVKAYQKYKDKSQDEQIKSNRRDIDKLIKDMESLQKQLQENFKADQKMKNITESTNKMVSDVVSSLSEVMKELKQFKEVYWNDRIRDKERKIDELTSKKDKS